MDKSLDILSVQPRIPATTSGELLEETDYEILWVDLNFVTSPKIQTHQEQEGRRLEQARLPMPPSVLYRRQPDL